jgi:hypothetical protein
VDPDPHQRQIKIRIRIKIFELDPEQDPHQFADVKPKCMNMSRIIVMRIYNTVFLFSIYGTLLLQAKELAVSGG